MIKLLYFISIFLIIMYVTYYYLVKDSISKYLYTKESLDYDGTLQYLNMILMVFLYIFLILYGIYTISSND